MKLKAKFQADVVRFNRKRLADASTESTLDLEFSVKPEEAEAISEEFHALAFGFMRVGEDKADGGATVAYLARKVTPDPKVVVLELHHVSVDGESFDTQPKILGVSGVPGKKQALVSLRFPLPDSAGVRSALEKRVGKTVEINMAEKQGELGFQTKKAAKGDATAEATTH